MRGDARRDDFEETRENSAFLPISFRQGFFYEFYRESYKMISCNR